MNRPLVLSPAGSPEALYAALEAGADEVYFGLWAHNARQNAKNFTRDEAREAFRVCRLRGVSTNVTLNTLVTDRELPDAVRLAYDALCMGADAFIVQDIGLARSLKRAIPEIVLHASTQCACHSTAGARQLIDAGFERIVLARELDESSIRNIVSLGAETEIFVHGALCVCHSGMCLMSSVIGGRSGNRGLCAQPCRLPYELESAENTLGRGRKATESDGYPLSLKDLSLARHVPKLAALGVTSLKIEGRMKPPEYVRGVTSIWKTLVSENRSATAEEYAYLEQLFSRSGFTDGYFTDAYRTDNRAMYGVRTALDKQMSKTASIPQESALPVKRPVCLEAEIAENCPPVLTVRTADGTASATVTADFTAQTAASRPLTEEDIRAALGKFGDTHFMCSGIQIHLQGSVFIAKSQLNALRRLAVAALEEKLTNRAVSPPDPDTLRVLSERAAAGKKRSEIGEADSAGAGSQPPLRLFAASAAGVEKLLAMYADYPIESVCLPLAFFAKENFAAAGTVAEKEYRLLKDRAIPFGVRMPRALFDDEAAGAREALKRAKAAGAGYAVAENIGQLSFIRQAELALCCGAGLNVFNAQSLAYFAACGAENVTLSPELRIPQMRDLEKPSGTATAVIAAGRLELMVLESCVIRAKQSCGTTENGGICAGLRDRTGTGFPIRAEQRLGEQPYPCRNILLNSIPVHLLQKPDELQKSHADLYCIYE